MNKSQAVILMLLRGKGPRLNEVFLVKNKRGTKKRMGWGGPGGTVEVGETIYDGADRERREETALPDDTITFFNKKGELNSGAEVITYIIKRDEDGSRHTKNLLAGVVIAENTPVNKKTDEIIKAQWFSLQSLPGGERGIYEDHLSLFQDARKKLLARGVSMDLIAVDSKVSDRVHDKNRSERPDDFRGGRGGNKKGQYGRRNDFRGRTEGREGRPNFAKQNFGGQRREEDRPEKSDERVEQFTYKE